MLFKIDFEVDNGASYQKDTAIVDACSFDDAKEKLNKFMNKIDSETCISQIFSISLFTGDIFTGQHGNN
jgi:hypothetical protein